MLVYKKHFYSSHSYGDARSSLRRFLHNIRLRLRPYPLLLPAALGHFPCCHPCRLHRPVMLHRLLLRSAGFPSGRIPRMSFLLRFHNLKLCRLCYTRFDHPRHRSVVPPSAARMFRRHFPHILPERNRSPVPAPPSPL